MKILIRHETNASHYIYSGLANAFRKAGHEAVFWNVEQSPAFDAFDKVQPDMFIGQGYNLDKATIKRLGEDPNTIVVLKVGYWGGIDDDIDLEEYPVLMASDEERNKVARLQNPLLLFNYCHDSFLDYIMSGWKDIAPLWGFPPAADIDRFYKTPPNPDHTSDMAFIGGYWPYKAKNLDKYILPLCDPVGKYNIKIFGNQPWPVSQYMGMIDDDTARSFLSNAKVCPSVHEPHANKFGFEILSRVFNSIACGSVVVTDYVETIERDMFPKGVIPIARSPEEYFSLIDYYLNNERDRKKKAIELYKVVMQKHTYEHRYLDLMDRIEEL